MRRTKGFISLLTLIAIAGLPVLGSVSRRPGVEVKSNESQGSLRGVLRALERRRRAPPGAYPLANFQDQDPQDIIDYLGSRSEYQSENPHVFLNRVEPSDKELLISYLEKDEYPTDDLNYKATAFRERNDQLKGSSERKKSTSAFRELESKNNYQSEQMQFLKSLADKEEEREESEAEYAELLKKLWEKYKYTHPEGPEYKKRVIRKRQIPGDYSPSGGWGPIAFKRKRSSNQRLENSDAPDFLYSLKFVSQSDPAAVENLKDEKLVDEEEDSDIASMINNQEENKYSGYDPSQPLELDDDSKMALQPLNYSPSDEEYLPDGSELIEPPNESIYPISKRSSNQRFSKRNLQNSKSKQFRSIVTDPKVMKDLSAIFGNSFDSSVQKQVKRSNDNSHIDEFDSHESKSPSIAAYSHNDTIDHSASEPHSRHEHESKPPLLVNTINEFEHSHEGPDVKEIEEKEFAEGDDSHLKIEHPIVLEKKSIDWSNYFGMDKRKKKSMMGIASMAHNHNAKRMMNYNNWKNVHHEESSEKSSDSEKRKPKQIDQMKLETMDNKLKNMESVIVDDALSYGADGLDTQEEQEMKEKIISRLAAAYSLQKMRKALHELKLSLRAQKDSRNNEGEDKEKHKKSEVEPDDGIKHKLDPEDIAALEDNYFENEQGAGHFLNGPLESMSEGYMGGAGNKFQYYDNDMRACPMLDRIIERCQNVDILAGDHGQLFLPLCSLHQICYLCGPSSPTGCDLLFLSEADSICDGRSGCQRAARGALMALRDLHGPLAHHMQGECSRDSCVARPLRENDLWQQPFRR